jgi:hypothetical protein
MSAKLKRKRTQSPPYQSKREDIVTFEYLLVNFRENRTVLADGMEVGVTNHILMLPPDDYTITLDGDPTTPPAANVALQNTMPMRPRVVLFT